MKDLSEIFQIQILILTGAGYIANKYRSIKIITILKIFYKFIYKKLEEFYD